MEKLTIQQINGRRMAIVQRNEALERYYGNPNICKNCGNVIAIPEGGKVAEARRKKFCNYSCSAIYSNPNRAVSKIKQYHYCSICGKKSRGYRCMDCYRGGLHIYNGNITKKELRERCKNYQSYRNAIRRHAKKTCISHKIDMKCIYCGYELYVEICHKTPVRKFTDDCKLKEINHISNLVVLCPNHHWEFDNMTGALPISATMKFMGV